MAFVEWLIHETSLHSLVNNGSRDIYIILLLRFLRMFAYGGAALVLGIFLYTAGNNGTQIGTFLTMTLLGDAAISYMLVIMADRIGRRRVLVIGSLLMTLAGTVFAFSKNYYLLLFAAVVGVISPGAHEVGPFRAVQVCVFSVSRVLGDLRMFRSQYSPSSHRSRLAQTSTHGGLSLPP